MALIQCLKCGRKVFRGRRYRLLQKVAISKAVGLANLRGKDMGKVIGLEKRGNNQRFMNEDVYRDSIFEALSALEAGDLQKAEGQLAALLQDVEKVLAGGEL